MFEKIASKIADSKRADSYAVSFRLRRFKLFMNLIKDWPRPIKILDIGGTEFFWETMGLAGSADYKIVIMNLNKPATHHANIESIQGDARTYLESLKDQNTFQIVFSNSVIEHIGDLRCQAKMADQIIKMGLPYWVQTPNRNFPLESHCLIPFFQFFPVWLKSFLIRNFKIRGYRHFKEKKFSDQEAGSIRLLNRDEMVGLFPGCQIYNEKCFGLVKSLIAYGGFPGGRE